MKRQKATSANLDLSGSLWQAVRLLMQTQTDGAVDRPVDGFIKAIIIQPLISLYIKKLSFSFKNRIKRFLCEQFLCRKINFVLRYFLAFL
jgi:hypothetical protein